MTPRELAIAKGWLKPGDAGPTAQAWRDVPTLRLDRAGKDEAKRELAGRRYPR
jgi:hypothetical protein